MYLLPVLLLLLSLAAPSWASQARSGARARWSRERTAAAASAAGAEREILHLVNRERRSRGLRPLVADEQLAAAARAHSRRMAAAHRMTHRLAGEPVFSRRLARVGLRFDASGENVALAPGAAAAHRALMHSPPHRANILDREFTAVGIGVVASGGEIYVTQDFAHLLPRAGVSEAELRVARSLNQLRRAAGEPALRRRPAPLLRRRACEMADADRLNPRDGVLPGADDVIAFTAMDLTKLPPSIRALRNRRASAFSVGACYSASRSYGEPVFWILLVTYR